MKCGVITNRVRESPAEVERLVPPLQDAAAVIDIKGAKPVVVLLLLYYSPAQS